MAATFVAQRLEASVGHELAIGRPLNPWVGFVGHEEVGIAYRRTDGNISMWKVGAKLIVLARSLLSSCWVANVFSVMFDSWRPSP